MCYVWHISSYRNVFAASWLSKPLDGIDRALSVSLSVVNVKHDLLLNGAR